MKGGHVERKDIKWWSIPTMHSVSAVKQGFGVLHASYAHPQLELLGKSLKWNCLTPFSCQKQSLPASGILSLLGVNYMD